MSTGVEAVALLGQRDDRAALGRLVGQADDSSTASASSRSVDAADREELGRHAVAVGDGAGLVEQQGRQSPAASTARPDMASTLRCTRRSMPAMPMADSSAPMVVGIRQTSRATSTMIDWRGVGVDGERLQRDDGQQEDDREPGQQDVEGDLVRRLLPARPLRPGRSSGRGSVSPGLGGDRTTIRSDSTRVPPVTAERSPPDSRITGADSPVMADSSTEAMPSTTSPSPGISSPGLDDAQVADLQLGGRRLDDRAVRLADVGDGLGAGLAQRVGLGLAPPSATASAKLANSTVNHSQTATRPANTLSAAVACGRSRRNRTVVRTLPTRPRT